MSCRALPLMPRAPRPPRYAELPFRHAHDAAAAADVAVLPHFHLPPRLIFRRFRRLPRQRDACRRWRRAVSAAMVFSDAPRLHGFDTMLMPPADSMRAAAPTPRHDTMPPCLRPPPRRAFAATPVLISSDVLLIFPTRRMRRADFKAGLPTAFASRAVSPRR